MRNKKNEMDAVNFIYSLASADLFIFFCYFCKFNI